LSEQLSTAPVQAFIRLLQGHAATTRVLSADLVSEHGLTINDYEALLRLSRAPEYGMKRVELAESLLLTPSGVTRLLDGLERAGYAEKGSCDTDARITYAVLTEADARAIAVYLKSVPPVRFEVPRDVRPGETPAAPYMTVITP